MEFVDEMGPELVTPSRCVALASFEADISEGLGEDMGGEIIFRVLAASAVGYSGGPLVRITSVSTAATGTHLSSSRLCINLDVKLTHISTLRCGLTIS